MEAVLETHGLSKSYGSRQAVKSLDLSVGQGEIFGFLGPNGAGKTTTIRMALGMIQRLGLAIALLNDPDLLILDEPANGLDPAGVVEMRDLLRNLAGQGKTVFISSHVLSEVQQICGRVAIINLGELIKVATVE